MTRPPLVTLAAATPPPASEGGGRERARSRIQIAKTGRFRDPRYGEFEITRDMFDRWRRSLKLHPDGRVLIDVEHQSERGGSSEAAGWIVELDTMGPDGNTPTPDQLWATVEWTSLGEQLVRDGRYRFVSPAFGAYRDEQGRVHTDVLTSVALTNVPFLREGMAPVALDRVLAEEVTDSVLLAQVTDRPWDGSASRYSDEQWRRACVLDTGEDTTPKQRYKLPVREPDGTLNRNAVHAAAAALAGARGGVQAPEEAKRAAARKLIQLYGELGEEPPEALRRLAADTRRAAMSEQRDTDTAVAEVRKLLDLPAEAPDSELVERVRTLAEQARELGDKVVLDRAEHRQLLNRIEELERRDRDRDFSELFDRAVREMRVAAADEVRQHWRRLFDRDPDAVRKLLLESPPVAPTAPTGRAADSDQPVAPRGVDPERWELDRRARKLMSEDPQLDYVRAVERAAQEVAG